MNTLELLKNEEIISELNELIEVCKDGQEGFKTAAADIKNPDYKELLINNEKQRKAFAHKLQQEIHSLGGDPDKHGTTVGALHRGWIDIKSVVTKGDENAILAECERGEHSALEHYRSVIQKQFPKHIHDLIQSQLNEIETSYEKMRTFTVLTEK